MNLTRNAHTTTATAAAVIFSEWHTFCFSLYFALLTHSIDCLYFRMIIVAFACPLQWFSDSVILQQRTRKIGVHKLTAIWNKNSASTKNKAKQTNIQPSIHIGCVGVHRERVFMGQATWNNNDREERKQQESDPEKDCRPSVGNSNNKQRQRRRSCWTFQVETNKIIISTTTTALKKRNNNERPIYIFYRMWRNF